MLQEAVQDEDVAQAAPQPCQTHASTTPCHRICQCTCVSAHILIAYIVMAYVGMACIVMAEMVVACVVMAYILMAYSHGIYR